jgi:hypothetical protein
MLPEKNVIIAEELKIKVLKITEIIEIIEKINLIKEIKLYKFGFSIKRVWMIFCH